LIYDSYIVCFSPSDRAFTYHYPYSYTDDGRVYIDGGQQMIYEWQIPDDSPRLFGFYHNHVHGTGAYSMLSGLHGAFVIEDPASHQVTADIAAAPQVSEHFLLLSESKTYQDGSPMNFIPIVMAFDWTHVTNGQVNPTYHFKKGETVHFRAVNAGVEPPMFLSIEGHELLPYARDGFPIPSPQVTDTVRIGAGVRSEFLVKFDTPGTYRFVRGAANFGITGELCGVLFGLPPEVTTCVSFDKEDTIASIVVSEEEVETDDTIELWDPLNANVEPAKKRDAGAGSDEMSPYLKSLLDLPNAGSRTITLNQATSFPIFQIPYDGPPEGLMVGFGINSRLHNPHYFHGNITGGTCEDWLFLYENDSPFHTIHTHSVPFYVTSKDGVEFDEKDRFWADTFATRTNFTATVCFPPREIESYINVHCHMMQHQDVGMAAFYKLLPGEGESEIEGGNSAPVAVNDESSSGKKQMSVAVVAFVILSNLYRAALL
jgi:FtsP/CotA-like multicopper oxidase with cupredoxin domain